MQPDPIQEQGYLEVEARVSSRQDDYYIIEGVLVPDYDLKDGTMISGTRVRKNKNGAWEIDQSQII